MIWWAFSGSKATRILKSDPETKNYPIVMLTAKGQKIDIEKGLEAGAEDYFVKPFSPLELIKKVEEILAKVRPALERDGGNVELVEVEDGTVKVKLVGACAGCPMSTMTLKNGIERILKQEIPEVKEVIAVK